MQHTNGRSAQRGVTLLELMVVMVIVAILAAVAIPTYRKQVVRNNRSNAKTALTQVAQSLERCYTRSSTYVGCGDVALPLTTPEVLYIVDADPDVGINATTYGLIATPQGGQANDTVCGSFKLNEVNQRAETGTGTWEECWNR